MFSVHLREFLRKLTYGRGFPLAARAIKPFVPRFPFIGAPNTHRPFGAAALFDQIMGSLVAAASEARLSRTEYPSDPLFAGPGGDLGAEGGAGALLGGAAPH